MSQFSKEFSESEIRQHTVAQIPWGTLITVIIPKSKSHEEMLWYIEQTYKNKWSRSQVELQFKAIKKHKRKMLTSSLGKIRILLEYKCEYYGKILKKINRYYASSQTCSRCGKTYTVY